MYFETQTFLVAGLSRSGISASRVLLERGAKVYLFDDVEKGAVLDAREKLEKLGAVTVLPENLTETMEKCDVLVLSPGIPIDHSLPVAFRKAGKRIVGELELGATLLKCPSVAVTGTNGKTTTVTMLEEIFKASGKNAVACGNVGKPLTSCAMQLDEKGLAVVEVSSFQLETINSFCPHAAVVLNVTEDHLNRHYTMENYVYLKRRLLKNSTESEYAVLCYDDALVRSFAEKTKAKIIWFSTKEKVDGGYIYDGYFCFFGEKLFPVQALAVEGEHNRADALAAICTAKLMGVKTEIVERALRSFHGVAHRIQTIGSFNGVRFINDSKATNIDSTIKAVESMKAETVLLVGGKDKGYSFDPLFAYLKTSSVVHVVIYGENAFGVLNSAMKENYTSVTLCQTLEMAFKVACMVASSGQNILLSPASASFDAFSGYEERGERFRELFEALKDGEKPSYEREEG